MGGKLVECVPNISEGRRPEVVQAVVDAVQATAGVRLLDVQSDPSHNRSVITFAGPPQAVGEAAFALCARAVELIDMNLHHGEHPRIGAVDVVPFVPIAHVTMPEAVELARALGARLWAELRLPVYFYAEAATVPGRVRLPDIRKGEYEGLAEKMADPAWAPDVGEAHPHPTAGATVVGARRPLIAYNINLHTTAVEVAREIARAVRESSGGLVNVQAMGVVAASGQAQVSLNLLDHTHTPLARVFELVRREAERFGVQVAESEIVGLVPLDALVDVARYYLRLRQFQREQILDVRLLE
ncbi:MAG: glutamate formimidoyltransferase [Armatimonadota bacterium]|nr:glutamate formimidoyltransferase [Armatimonadota bacterium]MDR7427306.1 glutamate formimidoyltransferase [Armatimonadota bacterium]MDR7463874.1 glutamate formimidoyltransferase [Armatimonadota bacterium]MDR7469928.1 glutamate formimidoyltransferase [Armatimonadota bacterium]MDR7474613.1 glutamate formimidoyltransferase [Armatimonadota bacterium]